jgi:hypothetical protein
VAAKEIAHRMKQVMGWNSWSAREWARQAGIHESHLNTIMTRLRADGRGTNITTLSKLAEAANVSLDWLWSGRGSPSGPVTNIQDTRYPCRGRVIAALKFLGEEVPKGVVDALLAEEGFVDDPGVQYWWGRAKIESDRITADNAKLPRQVIQRKR